jgi:hypothetical protein
MNPLHIIIVLLFLILCVIFPPAFLLLIGILVLGAISSALTSMFDYANVAIPTVEDMSPAEKRKQLRFDRKYGKSISILLLTIGAALAGTIVYLSPSNTSAKVLAVFVSVSFVGVTYPYIKQKR